MNTLDDAAGALDAPSLADAVFLVCGVSAEHHGCGYASLATRFALHDKAEQILLRRYFTRILCNRAWSRWFGVSVTLSPFRFRNASYVFLV